MNPSLYFLNSHLFYKFLAYCLQRQLQFLLSYQPLSNVTLSLFSSRDDVSFPSSCSLLFLWSAMTSGMQHMWYCMTLGLKCEEIWGSYFYPWKDAQCRQPSDKSRLRLPNSETDYVWNGCQNQSPTYGIVPSWNLQAQLSRVANVVWSKNQVFSYKSRTSSWPAEWWGIQWQLLSATKV